MAAASLPAEVGQRRLRAAIILGRGCGGGGGQAGTAGPSEPRAIASGLFGREGRWPSRSQPLLSVAVLKGGQGDECRWRSQPLPIGRGSKGGIGRGSEGRGGRGGNGDSKSFASAALEAATRARSSRPSSDRTTMKSQELSACRRAAQMLRSLASHFGRDRIRTSRRTPARTALGTRRSRRKASRASLSGSPGVRRPVVRGLRDQEAAGPASSTSSRRESADPAP